MFVFFTQTTNQIFYLTNKVTENLCRVQFLIVNYVETTFCSNETRLERGGKLLFR